MRRAVQDGRDAQFRELSKSYFGLPNDPLKVQVNNLGDLFGVDPSQLTIEQLKDFVLNTPEVQKLTHITLVDQPTPPIEVTPSSASRFLTRSRYFRAGFPMLDKLSKKFQNPSRDSQKLKFDLGIDLSGCFLVGAGGISSSTVPEAGQRVDTETGDDVFVLRPGFTDEILVSAITVPTFDGLGSGSSPPLAEWLDGLARNGHRIVAKLTILDLEYLTAPYKIVWKPRPHNIEVIVTFNIPGVQIQGFDDLLQGIIEANVRRNAQCGQGFIDTPLDYENFDESLLRDTRDFSDYGAVPVLEFQGKNRRNALHSEKGPNFDRNKCRSLYEAGFFVLSDHVNMFTIKKLLQLKELDERIDYLSRFHRAEDAASILTILNFVGKGSIELKKAGRKWLLKDEAMF